MIQEVVGSRIGDYFFPTCAGVAFSDIEIPWSPRILRTDGLVRMVPGLGTRAVDRTGDDYPILSAPGQPGLRANVSVDEMVRYSPKNMDVINLKTGAFETVNALTLISKLGSEYPNVSSLLSKVTGDRLKPIKNTKLESYDPKDLIITFEGLFSTTPFLTLLHTILTKLKNILGYPVDIEFACDGDDFYLLQCRSQSYDHGGEPAVIPAALNQENIIFSANRYVPNGHLTNLSHLVYIDPHEYYNLQNHQDLVAVGKAVSKLNELLPMREFILIGPGRWGSRGEIKLGVRVTYSDIRHTAMLVEVAETKGPYQPDPSFGTHFFQDLVEATIRYLPLFPDEPGGYINREFFKASKNQLPKLLPDFEYLSHVIRVVDVPAESDGMKLQIFMNAFSKQAVAVLQPPIKEQAL
jgi:hypothetical protein